jgi:hypothetical protein
LRCSLPAELARDARGAEEENLDFAVIVVGIDEVAAPPESRLVSLALAFRTDQRLPHVRTLVDTSGRAKMSRRDATPTLTPRRLAFDHATAAALERR